ncbi:unnamed protein product, partial [Pelagomonas calceolata]
PVGLAAPLAPLVRHRRRAERQRDPLAGGAVLDVRGLDRVVELPARIAREDEEAPRREADAERREVTVPGELLGLLQLEGHHRLRRERQQADRRPRPGVIGVGADLAVRRRVAQAVEPRRQECRQPEVVDAARERLRPLRNRRRRLRGRVRALYRDLLVRARARRARPYFLRPAVHHARVAALVLRAETHVPVHAPRATDVVPTQQDRLDGAHEVALLVGRHEIVEHDQALHGRHGVGAHAVREPYDPTGFERRGILEVRIDRPFSTHHGFERVSLLRRRLLVRGGIVPVALARRRGRGRLVVRRRRELQRCCSVAAAADDPRRRRLRRILGVDIDGSSQGGHGQAMRDAGSDAKFYRSSAQECMTLPNR